MPKDIRKILENYPEESVNLSANHSNKFESKLMKELHQEKPKRRTVYWLSIAASIALLVSVGLQFINIGGVNDSDDEIVTKPVENKISLGTISPELNTIEAYYVNSINLELSQLEITDR